jgi:hypothetical protein
MLRKAAKRRSEGKRKNVQPTAAQRASVYEMANGLKVTPDQEAASRRMEARLKSAARAAFQQMGED